MKKGISLIVLVITIIVLAILAGAVIISLSNTNVMQEAKEAAELADLANAKHAVTLEYASKVAASDDGKAYSSGTTLMVESDYITALTNAGFTNAATEYTVTVVNGVPTNVATK